VLQVQKFCWRLGLCSRSCWYSLQCFSRPSSRMGRRNLPRPNFSFYSRSTNIYKTRRLWPTTYDPWPVCSGGNNKTHSTIFLHTQQTRKINLEYLPASANHGKNSHWVTYVKTCNLNCSIFSCLPMIPMYVDYQDSSRVKMLTYDPSKNDPFNPCIALSFSALISLAVRLHLSFLLQSGTLTARVFCYHRCTSHSAADRD